MGLFGSSSRSTSTATHGDTGAADYGTSFGGIDSPAVVGMEGGGATIGAGKSSEIGYFSTVVDPGAFSFVIGEGAQVEGLTLSTPQRPIGEDILSDIRKELSAKAAPVTGNTGAGLIAGALPALLIAGAAYFLFAKGGSGKKTMGFF